MVKKLSEKEFREAGIRGDIPKGTFLKSVRNKAITIKIPKEEVILSKLQNIFNEIRNISVNLSRDIQTSNKDNMLFQVETNKNIASISKTASISKISRQPQSNPVGAVWEFDADRDAFNNIIFPIRATRIK